MEGGLRTVSIRGHLKWQEVQPAGCGGGSGNANGGGRSQTAGLPAAVRVEDHSGVSWCSHSQQFTNGLSIYRSAPCWAISQSGQPAATRDDAAHPHSSGGDGGTGGGWQRGQNDAAVCSRPEDAARLSVLVLTVAMHNNSFGLIRDKGLVNKGPRGIEGFLGMLAEQDYPPCRLSLGLLVSSNKFYPSAVRIADQFVRDKGWSRLVVVNKALDLGVNPAKRHQPQEQRHRRGMLARLRNLAVSLALDLEDAVLWIDSDITEMPKHTLVTLVDSGKDIITTVTKGWDEVVYDLNAWTLPRRPYNASERESFVPGPIPGKTKWPNDFERGREPFVPLDSVGGCTTLVRADVHREGAMFAPYYPIGATWESDGYDGVESEGLCYVARHLGRSCWLAAHITTYHQSYWV